MLYILFLILLVIIGTTKAVNITTPILDRVYLIKPNNYEVSGMTYDILNTRLSEADIHSNNMNTFLDTAEIDNTKSNGLTVYNKTIIKTHPFFKNAMDTTDEIKQITNSIDEESENVIKLISNGDLKNVETTAIEKLKIVSNNSFNAFNAYNDFKTSLKSKNTAKDIYRAFRETFYANEAASFLYNAVKAVMGAFKNVRYNK